MRKVSMITCLLLIAVSKVWTQPVNDELPQITNCIALINAKLVSAPGKSPSASNIIMRNGIIVQSGENLKIPDDAYRIIADSLYVYPAFIDAFSSIGIKEPESNQQQGQGGPPGGGNRGQRTEVDLEGNPSLEEAGITPFNDVRMTFDAKDKSIIDWRAQGFAIAHVVPRGKMIPGMGSLIVLSGKSSDQMLWKENMSMYAQWTGSGGGYPATVIGVMAKWRELYHNAEQMVQHETSYANATSIPRPMYNHAQAALKPVVKGEMPLYFRSPKVKDISRALTMQKDLGMKMVIADAEEAWYLKDQLKTGTIPLILSLDLAEDKSEKKKDDAGKGKETSTDSTKTDTTKKVEEKEVKPDPEKEAFEKRRAESLKAHWEQAGVLSKEGIRFGFGTMSGKSGDFIKNMQTMIENGLSKDDALASLTTVPAKILGVEKYCGTIEAGKMANMIVCNGPLFEKETVIRFVIVDGKLYEYEVKEKKKATGSESPAALAQLEGSWSYTIDTPDQKREGTFEFKKEGNELSGTMSSPDITTGNNQLDNIVIEGSTASFTFDFDMGGQQITLEFDLKLDGEAFEGTVTAGELGSFPISGHRTSKPN